MSDLQNPENQDPAQKALHPGAAQEPAAEVAPPSEAQRQPGETAPPPGGATTCQQNDRQGAKQSLTRWPEGAPTTTTQFFSRQIKTNNVTTTIILTKMYPSI